MNDNALVVDYFNLAGNGSGGGAIIAASPGLETIALAPINAQQEFEVVVTGEPVIILPWGSDNAEALATISDGEIRVEPKHVGNSGVRELSVPVVDIGTDTSPIFYPGMPIEIRDDADDAVLFVGTVGHCDYVNKIVRLRCSDAIADSPPALSEDDTLYFAVPTFDATTGTATGLRIVPEVPTRIRKAGWMNYLAVRRTSADEDTEVAVSLMGVRALQ